MYCGCTFPPPFLLRQSLPGLSGREDVNVATAIPLYQFKTMNLARSYEKSVWCNDNVDHLEEQVGSHARRPLPHAKPQGCARPRVNRPVEDAPLIYYPCQGSSQAYNLSPPPTLFLPFYRTILHAKTAKPSSHSLPFLLHDSSASSSKWGLHCQRINALSASQKGASRSRNGGQSV